MATVYLIKAVDGWEPQLLGPFPEHVDTTSPPKWIKEEGWIPTKGCHPNPNWTCQTMRGTEKLYRVTAKGIVQLIEAANAFREAAMLSGYSYDHS